MIISNIIDETQDFFHCIFRSMPCKGYLEYRAIKGVNVESRFISIFDEDTIEELKSLNDEDYDIFFGVGSRNEKRGVKSSVCEIPTLWVDFDRKRDESRSSLKERLDLIIENLGMEPTLIVDSGYGYHLYFVLIDFVFVRSERTSK